MPVKAWLADRRSAVGFGCIVAAAISIYLAVTGHIDRAGFALNIAVLAVAAVTLFATWAQPGRLIVERQHELGVDDILFFLYPDDQLPGGQLPHDYLLQAHLAIANVGRRTAVLSGLNLVAYLDAAGKVVTSPLLPSLMPAQAYRQWLSRNASAGTTSIQSETTYPPFLLEADAVLTLRIRWRGGVDWSGRWDLATLRQAAESLASPITQARLLVIYRSGRALRRDTVVVPLVVQAQDAYRRHLGLVTREFTELPIVRPRPIDPYEGSGIPIAH